MKRLTKVLILCLGIAGLRAADLASASAPGLSTPIIHCSWAMVSVSDDDTFLYGPDDTTSPALIESEAACKSDSTRVALQADGAQGLLHLKGNNPQLRNLELWAAVSNSSNDAFGTSEGTVSWTIHTPDGQELTRVDQPQRSCAGVDQPGPMWITAAKGFASSGSGAFSLTTVTNESGTGLWQACRQGQLRVFSARTTLPANAPCGMYSVSTTANSGVAATTLRYGIDVLCPASAVMDTANIHWNVEPGGTAVVQGDLDPTTSDHPTITNTGDGPVQIGLEFTPLRRADMSDTIAQFGAMVVPKTGPASGLSRLAGNTLGWIPGPASVLCPGKSMPINLVITAPVDLPSGEYSGSVRVLARAGGRC
jgi:hypothetical protein